MKKEKIALIINIIILVLEVIGFGNTIINNHKIAIEYYTNDSNLIALISSLLFIKTSFLFWSIFCFKI